MRRDRWLYLSLLIVVAAGGVTAGLWIRNQLSGGDAHAGVDRSLACQQQAEAFTDYPLLYAGVSVLGYPLVGCDHSKTADQYDDRGVLFHAATDSFAFYYGTCVIPPNRESCPVPVTVIVDSPCITFAPDASSVKERVTVRGAEASVDDHGVTWFATPSYMLSVYPPGASYDEQKANALAIVEALVPVNAPASALADGAPLTAPLAPSAVCP